MAWFLTWLLQSVALGAATAALVRLPGFRQRAAARAAAWGVSLSGTAVLAWVPWLTWPATEAAGLVAAAASAGAADVRSPFVLPVISGGWLTAGLAIWVTGAAAWTGWVIREVVRVVRLKRACESWTAQDWIRLAPWVEPRLRARGVRLAWCDALDGPALLGFAHPVIALPRLHGARLSGEALQHVLLHEAAHLRRRDDWASLVELAVAGLLWINPVVHLARRGLGLAREMACDDWVVRQTSAPVAYARCLTAVADLRRARHRASLAAAATGPASVLARRVTRVLDADRRPSDRVSQLFALMTPVAVGALAVAMIQAPPLVVDGQVAPAAQVGAAPARPLLPGQTMPPPPRTAAVTAEPRRRIDAGRQDEAGRVVMPVTRARAAVAATNQGPAAPRVSDPIGAQVAAASPLSASPVPGFALPGVPAADPSVVASNVPDQNTPWWGRAARVGAATSEGATTAGRATASFLTRMGSSVAQSLSR